MWAGSTDYHEAWHIQSEETLVYTGDKAEFMTAGGDIVLKQGDNNPIVGSWQYDLDVIGFWPAGVAHNTNFGPTTAAQTNAFKKAQGLPMDGIVDEATWSKMADALRAKIAAEDAGCHAAQALVAAQAEQLKKLAPVAADLAIAQQKIASAKTALA